MEVKVFKIKKLGFSQDKQMQVNHQMNPFNFTNILSRNPPVKAPKKSKKLQRPYVHFYASDKLS